MRKLYMNTLNSLKLFCGLVKAFIRLGGLTVRIGPKDNIGNE